MVILFSFFLVFMFGTASNILLANILYFFIIIFYLLKNKPVRVIKNGSIILVYFVFLSWVIISTLAFHLPTGTFDFRIALQFLFTAQYFVFLINLGFDEKEFEKWVFIFSVLLALTILFLFIYTGQLVNIESLFSSGRLWAKDLVPGWPNTTPIPLLIGLWLAFRNKKGWVFKAILLSGLILTTSRVALLGAILIALHSKYISIKNKRNLIIYLSVSIPLFMLSIPYVLDIIFSVVPSLEHRVGVFYDRIDIIFVTIEYVKLKPLLGFGGNTLGQISSIYGDYGSLIEWPHTHSWILEMALRYGIVGLALFSIFMLLLIVQIKDSGKRFMFILLLSAAVFQIYIRGFVFVYFLVYLSQNNYKALRNK